MTEIIIEKTDQVHARIKCDPGTGEELSTFFSFRPPGYQFMPAFKARVWDGWFRLFNPINPWLKVGHLERLRFFCSERGYGLREIGFEDSDQMTFERAEEFAQSLNLCAKGSKIQAKEHQLRAFAKAMTDRRLVLVSPTASGKSLIMYLMIRKILKDNPRAKILITVPGVNLVDQLWEDFVDYSSENAWPAGSLTTRISGGRGKDAVTPVTVSTWQSIYKMPDEWFQQFDAVIGDEAHTNKAKSLDSIMCRLKNADFRVGLTGTLNESEIDKLVLIGHFGEPYVVTTTKTLMEQGVVSQAKFLALRLIHSDHEIKALASSGGMYETEIGVITRSVPRVELLAKMAVNVERNTILYFKRVEHGKAMFDAVKRKANGSRRVYFMYGGTSPEERAKIRADMNVGKDAILVASTGTFSTGGDIRNVGCLIMGHPLKTNITHMQSVGRGLRVSDDGKPLVVIDVIDDLTSKKRQNYAFEHGKIRLARYRENGFNVKHADMKLQENQA